ncbi:MAG: sialidase family protein [Deltaproteobacteria bacterium]|nr:sialidase family protein [Deltaproteobacteria bacterium]
MLIRSLLLLPLAFALACDAPGPGPAEGEGEGEGEGEVGDAFTLVSSQEIEGTDLLVVPGFAITARPDGRFAVAWFEEVTNTVECDLFAGGVVQGVVYALKIADEQVDGAVRIRTVDGNVPNTKEDSIDLAVDSSGAILLAYMGGTVTRTFCGASDLMLAVETGDTFSVTTVAATADTATTCRGEAGGDPYCGQGEVVGLYPGISVNGDDVAISYLDTHFGFADTDINASDLELAIGDAGSGLALSSINMESGGGYFSSATLTEDGTVVIGHAVVANNTFSDGAGGTFIVEDGIYVEVVDSAGVIKSTNLLPGVTTESRVATGSFPGKGLFVAVHKRGDEQLLIFNSVDDGDTWIPAPVENLGKTGRDPGIVFLDDGRLVLAYGHCRDDTNQNNCDSRKDGARLALQDGTRFIKQTLAGDSEDNEGVGVDVAKSGPAEVVVVHLNSSQNRLIVQRVQVN